MIIRHLRMPLEFGEKSLLASKLKWIVRDEKIGDGHLCRFATLAFTLISKINKMYMHYLNFRKLLSFVSCCLFDFEKFLLTLSICFIWKGREVLFPWCYKGWSYSYSLKYCILSTVQRFFFSYFPLPLFFRVLNNFVYYI